MRFIQNVCVSRHAVYSMVMRAQNTAAQIVKSLNLSNVVYEAGYAHFIASHTSSNFNLITTLPSYHNLVDYVANDSQRKDLGTQFFLLSLMVPMSSVASET